MNDSGSPTGHDDLGPELRQLAQAILDRIDPAVRGAAAMAAARSAGDPGRCQVLWCPVCALAALVTGEEHPLLTMIGEHSVALLTVIRMMVDGSAMPTPPPAPAPEPPDGAHPDGPPDQEPPEVRPTTGRYQPITIIVEE
ncbi:hypothetical protein [Mycolicibacterium komossense]|uniref:HNH endonuclease n=1 Tax=Mycolicibacterium komossense TaxID=1779 RepID=A0ABT3C6H9_9MYCO|nr:hypothetical protein [Mycolicibacterium komossense]MCV7225065.1 hypothetical protein [Mycolicibacterium komossense]